MEVNTMEVSNVQSFLDSIINPQNGGAQQNQEGAAASNEEVDEGAEGEEKGKEGDGTDKTKEFLENLNKEKKEEGEEGEKAEKIEEISKLSELLEKDNILFKFEDDTLPSTYEDLKIGLEQSSIAKANQIVDKILEERIESYSPSMRTIMEYAESGVTSATDLNRMIAKVSYAEQIAALDPTKPEDQERIVMTQLLLSGMDENLAREQVNDYKTAKRLEGLSSTFYPQLKRKADEEIAKEQRDKELKSQHVENYINDNAKLAEHFIDNPSDVLPFKITSNNYKTNIFQIAAQPVGIRPETGEVIFGWETYLKSLQNGDEAKFKKFMEIMTFIASPKAFKEQYGKVVSNESKTSTFRKIKTNEASRGGYESDKVEGNTIKIPKQAPQSNPWSI